MSRRGCFLTLEGGEGAGKSTQARLLADALCRRGLPVLRTREPGGAPGAETLRRLLLDPPADWSADWSKQAQVFLHFAARAEHVERTIRPALAAGFWVVCDRFIDSTRAYQGFGQGVDQAMIMALAAQIDLIPDVTFILDVSENTATIRRTSRAGLADRYESEGEEFHARIRAGFRAIASGSPERCRLIPADGSIADVHAAILGHLR